jgi:hypothetical protein
MAAIVACSASESRDSSRSTVAGAGDVADLALSPTESVGWAENNLRFLSIFLALYGIIWLVLRSDRVHIGTEKRGGPLSQDFAAPHPFLERENLEHRNVITHP